MGIHTGTLEMLISRYITSIPDVNVHSFVSQPSRDYALYIEKKIKTQFANLRTVNVNGNKSEWYNFTPLHLGKVVSMIDHGDKPTAMNLYTLQDMYVSGRLVVPTYQRPIDTDRVFTIKTYIISTYDKPEYYLSDIVLNCVDGVYRIIDGQHRLQALISLIGEDRKMLENYKPSITIKNNLTLAEEKALFIAINKSVPCPGMHMAQGVEQQILMQCRTTLMREYKHQISQCNKYMIPNINVDTILNSIVNKRPDGSSVLSDWVSDDTVSDADTLLHGIYALNTHIGDIYKSERGYKAYVSYGTYGTKKHTAAKFEQLLVIIQTKGKNTVPCYLGLLSVDNLVRCLFNHRLFF